MDIREKDLNRAEAVVLQLRSLYHNWGYEVFKMSRFEPYDLYARNRSFVTGDNILTFTDTNGRLMALKPDVTLSIVKNYRSGQRKVCYNESVFRDEGSSHEFREIMQVGLECMGEIDLYTQYEVTSLACESLRTLSDDYRLDLASVRVLSGLVEASGVGRQTQRALLKTVQHKNVGALRQLCREQGFSVPVTRAWEQLATIYGPLAANLPTLSELSLNDEMAEACRELEDLSALLSSGEDMHVNLDFSIVTDPEYYNGLVFQGMIPDVHGVILSGGRYDTLMKKLGKQAGAIGFAVYLNELEMLPVPPSARPETVLLRYGSDAAPAAVMARARALRASGSVVHVSACEGISGLTEEIVTGEEALS